MFILILQSYRWGRESWLLCLVCLPGVVMVVWLFLAVQWVCLRFVIVVFPDHTHILFSNTLFTFYTTKNYPETQVISQLHTGRESHELTNIWIRGWIVLSSERSILVRTVRSQFLQFVGLLGISAQKFCTVQNFGHEFHDSKNREWFVPNF